jgi:hypothetical protein
MKRSRFLPLLVLACLVGFHLGLGIAAVRGDSPPIDEKCCEWCYGENLKRILWIQDIAEAKHAECGLPVNGDNFWCHNDWWRWEDDQMRYAEEDLEACKASCGGCGSSSLIIDLDRYTETMWLIFNT